MPCDRRAWDVYAAKAPCRASARILPGGEVPNSCSAPAAHHPSNPDIPSRPSSDLSQRAGHRALRGLDLYERDPRSRWGRQHMGSRRETDFRGDLAAGDVQQPDQRRGGQVQDGVFADLLEVGSWIGLGVGEDRCRRVQGFWGIVQAAE